MGRTIQKRAAIADILRDVRKTVDNASARGAPLHDDAQRFLAPVLSVHEELTPALEEAEHTLSQARSVRDAQDQACNDLIAEAKDRLYNMIGRTAGDPGFVRYYTGGKAPYTEVSPLVKPFAIHQLCATLETVPHPRIPPEEVTRVTTSHREAADALAEANHAMQSAAARVRILAGQRNANARLAAEQLAKLKRWWKIEGLSEPDIHQLIPDRPRRRSGDEDAEEGELVELVEASTEEDDADLAAK